MRDVVIVVLHVLLDELAHCVLQVGIKQLVAAGFGHIGLRFPEKRFKSYHYLRDFLDVSGIRNDYLALFVPGGLFYEISERIVHGSDLLCDKLREGLYRGVVNAVVHCFCQQGSLIEILGGFRAVGYRAGDSPERVFHCGFVLLYRGIQRHEPDKIAVIVLLRLEDRLL